MECLSALPGRVRFKSLNIYYNTELSEHIEKYILSLYGVKSTKITKRTGSILIMYDIKKTNLHILKEDVENALSASITTDNTKLNNFQEYFHAIDNKKRSKRKFLFWSLFYIFLKIKNSTYGKFPISRNLTVLKVASLVTIVSGYPLIKKLYKKFAKPLPTNEDILLELTALSFTIMRESSKGILVLMLKALNDYIKFSAEVESRKALIDSCNINYKMAWIKSLNGDKILVSIDTLKIGDFIYGNTGEVIPVEGIIEDGNAVINTLYHSGQPIISRISKGAKIHEGTAIISGELTIRILRLPNFTEKQDISPEKFYLNNRIKKFQGKITNFAIWAAGLSYIFTHNILNAFSVFLVLSPKATSVALNSGIKNYISLLNKNDIYLRNPNVFQNILNIDKVIFDKTGTLTYGKMNIISIISFDNKYSKEELLKICTACEYEHFHPISITLQDACSDFEISKLNNSVLLPSEGIKANYDNKEILIGNMKLMVDNQIDISQGIKNYMEYQEKSLTPIFITINTTLTGMLILDDIIKKDSRELINRLRYDGIDNIAILTGDSYSKAQKVGLELGISQIYADMNYCEKANIVKNESAENTVIMIGDGINDALAMKAADVSVSFANSSYDMIKLHSDCLIYDDNLTKLADLIFLSKASYIAINRTILFSNIYNITLGFIAFAGGLDIFTAKSLNTLNSLLVLLLNQRIYYINR
ncbi:HAD-IC family P-type ATPase [Clostridium sp. BL-8]|uniref:HAD-IC family P-type ATPase n=1 Tax=Clostridium sp. BL-8 TaxID=349938 RepID=UPI00098C0CA0|nr:HAD-IC family P-type ATPase [Clostridium sp. BL-8]OOM78935.1 putative copper-exporting P-type ATPase V [Clostridium sp. BL-8]